MRRAIIAAYEAGGFANERASLVRGAIERMNAWRIEVADRTALYLASQAIVGIVRATFEEAPEMMAHVDFEDELTALAEASLQEGRRV